MSLTVVADTVALGAGASAQELLPLSADPTTAGGVAAPVGSLGLAVIGGAGFLYNKVGAANTAWGLVAVGSSIPGLVATTTFAQTGVITPAALAGGTTNNYAPAGFATASRMRQNVTAASTLTGLAGGVTGQEMTINNINTTAANTLTLANANAGSLAANQFLLPSGLDWIIPAGGSVKLRYDGTSTAWRMEAVSTNNFPAGALANPGIVVGSDPTAGIFINAGSPTLTQASIVAASWGAGTFTALGSMTTTSGATFNTVFTTNGVISPTAFTGAAVNNYAPAGFPACSQIRQDCSSATSVSGLAAASAGENIWFYNINSTTGNTITLLHNSGLSTAGNRFLLPSNASVVIPVGGAVLLTYDGTSAAWRVTGKNF